MATTKKSTTNTTANLATAKQNLATAKKSLATLKKTTTKSGAQMAKKIQKSAQQAAKNAQKVQKKAQKSAQKVQKQVKKVEKTAQKTIRAKGTTAKKQATKTAAAVSKRAAAASEQAAAAAQQVTAAAKQATAEVSSAAAKVANAAAAKIPTANDFIRPLKPENFYASAPTSQPIQNPEDNLNPHQFALRNAELARNAFEEEVAEERAAELEARGIKYSPYDNTQANQLVAEAQKIMSTMNIADLERAQAYSRDLIHGLQTVRTFPQGVVVFGSARLAQDNKYCLASRELGQLLAQHGHAVITGGGPGIMEAANHGCYEYGGRSIGFNITLAHEQHANPYLTDCLEFKYFFARKVMLVMASKVFVLMPGGFGTMDELSEVLVLMQEGKMPKMPVFLFGKFYWKPLEDFFKKSLVKNKMIAPENLKIFKITDDVREIVRAADKVGHPRIAENYYDDFHEKGIY